MKMKRFLLVVFSLLLLLAFIGCSDDTNNSSVTNPNRPIVTPTGNIQGKIVDSCTGYPIVNAVVDIGMAKTTTNSDGQYKFKNIPATSYEETKDKNSHSWHGDYSATINMTNAYALRNVMQNGKQVVDAKGNAVTEKVTGAKYATYYYSEMEVVFSSQNESDGEVEDSNASSDTPIEGLTSGDQDIYIGQMTAGYSGKALLAKNHTPVSGYTVYFFSTDDGRDGNSSTGFSGHVAATTTTAADGTFSVTGLEAGKAFGIFVRDTSSATAKFEGFGSFMSGCDGSIFYDNSAIYLKSTDQVCPFILTTSPLMYTNIDMNTANDNIDADGNLIVKIVFSEDILMTPYNTGLALAETNTAQTLYNSIQVNYVGNKAGNVHHELSWLAANTLQIKILAEAVAPSAIYQISIVDPTYLTDANGNPLSNGPNAEGIVPCKLDSKVAGYKAFLQFYTFGSDVPEKPAGLTVKQPEDLDYYGYDNGLMRPGTVIIDWLPTGAAKQFAVYCQMMQWPKDTTCDSCDSTNCTTSGGQVHPYVLMTRDATPGTGFYLERLPQSLISGYNPLDDFLFVENRSIKLSYNCYVRGINLDGTEGPASDVVYIEDTVHPTVIGVASPGLRNYTYETYAVNRGDARQGAEDICIIHVYFSEPMNEKLVETVANWSLNTTAAAATISRIEYVDRLPGQQWATFFLSNYDEATDACITGAANMVVTANVLFLSTPTTAGNVQDVSGNPLAFSLYVTP